LILFISKYLDGRLWGTVQAGAGADCKIEIASQEIGGWDQVEMPELFDPFFKV